MPRTRAVNIVVAVAVGRGRGDGGLGDTRFGLLDDGARAIDGCRPHRHQDASAHVERRASSKRRRSTRRIQRMALASRVRHRCGEGWYGGDLTMATIPPAHPVM